MAGSSVFRSRKLLTTSGMVGGDCRQTRTRPVPMHREASPTRARADLAQGRGPVAQDEPEAYGTGGVVESVEREQLLDRRAVVDPVAARLAERRDVQAQLVVVDFDIARVAVLLHV